VVASPPSTRQQIGILRLNKVTPPTCSTDVLGIDTDAIIAKRDTGILLVGWVLMPSADAAFPATMPPHPSCLWIGRRHGRCEWASGNTPVRTYMHGCYPCSLYLVFDDGCKASTTPTPAPLLLLIQHLHLHLPRPWANAARSPLSLRLGRSLRLSIF
jgi:hypothetical protein